jgi:hypothetical protein
MVAEFESDLIRLRTREGMKVAEANGRLRGKQPKLRPNQAKHLLELHDLGNYIQAELAERFGVGRSTIYRTIDKRRPKPVEPERPFATSWCCRSVSQADRHRAELRRCRSQRPARADYIKGTCPLSRSKRTACGSNRPCVAGQSSETE